MEALQMLKFNYKKSRLNFMSDWQTVAIPDEDVDWLRILASKGDSDTEDTYREVFDSCELADGAPHLDMPEEAGFS
jgi:Ran GTPase-activating protein (RanGAP) involved in mRNA processing and transport